MISTIICFGSMLCAFYLGQDLLGVAMAVGFLLCAVNWASSWRTIVDDAWMHQQDHR